MRLDNFPELKTLRQYVQIGKERSERRSPKIWFDNFRSRLRNQGSYCWPQQVTGAQGEANQVTATLVSVSVVLY